MTDRRVHYGWWIVCAAVVIEFFGIGFGVFALTASYPYLIAEFGWSRTEVVSSMTVVVTTVAIFGPVTGMATDRFSIRRLFVIGSVVEACGLLALSSIRSQSEYWAACVLLGVGMSGVTVLPNQILVTRWFRTQLGWVNGIITAATVLGGAASPLLVTYLAEHAGWRTAFRVLAGLVAVFPPLIALALVRDRPADLGLAAYGDGLDVVEPAGPPPPGALGAVLRQPRFWLLGVTLFAAGWPCYAATKHVILYLREIGVEPMAAAGTLSWMLFAASGGRLAFGLLWDRLAPRTVLLLDFALLAVGGVLLLAADRPAVRWVYVGVFGLGYGGLMPLIPLTVVAYFGRRLMGSVTGCFKTFYDAAAAFAPLATAYLYDVQGTYRTAFALNAVLPCVAVVVALTLIGAPEAAAAAEPAAVGDPGVTTRPA